MEHFKVSFIKCSGFCFIDCNYIEIVLKSIGVIVTEILSQPTLYGITFPNNPWTVTLMLDFGTPF